MLLLRNRNRLLVLAAVLLLSIAGAAAAWRLASTSQPQRPVEPLGLFTTLPLYWGEATNVSQAIEAQAKPHWARNALERRYRLVRLTDESLGQLHDLLMAQPRALAPAENVALDEWVRGGGRLLLFADPLLTEHSAFPLGDKRRPQGAALLSPILAHWGLELVFDDGQSQGEREVELLGAKLPVEQAGRFELAAPAAEPACKLLARGLAVRCEIGRGQALIVADAALLDREGTDLAHRADVLLQLAAEAYGES